MDVDIAAVLRESGGVIARRDHPQLAFRLHRLVRMGELWSPLPGIFVAEHLRSCPEARIAAGALWCGPDAVVCGLGAARFSFWPDVHVETVELAVLVRHRARRAGWCVEQRIVPPELIRHCGSIRITSPALTAMDLAVGPIGGDIIDRVLRTRSASLADMQQALELTPGRRGNRLRAELLHDSRDEPWSEAERHLHRLFRRAGVTGWRGNVWIGDERSGFVADVLFERERVIVEVDGFATHGNRQAFEDDRHRRNMLVLAGYVVLNFTWRQIVERPGWVLACVLEALGRAQ